MEYAAGSNAPCDAPSKALITANTIRLFVLPVTILVTLQAIQAIATILFRLYFWQNMPQKMAAKQYVIENPAPDRSP